MTTCWNVSPAAFSTADRFSMTRSVWAVTPPDQLPGGRVERICPLRNTRSRGADGLGVRADRGGGVAWRWLACGRSCVRQFTAVLAPRRARAPS